LLAKPALQSLSFSAICSVCAVFLVMLQAALTLPTAVKSWPVILLSWDYRLFLSVEWFFWQGTSVITQCMQIAGTILFSG